MTDNNNRNTLKEAFDAELMKRLEENPPEIPTYEEFSAMVDKSLAERCRRRKRIAGIAAGFVVVLLTGILAYTNLTTDVDADKNPKEEIITEDGVIIEDGGWGSSEYEDNVWMTEDWRDVEGARVVVPELIIPQYIPEGYIFDWLIIESLETGASTCEYDFRRGKLLLEIDIRYHSNAVSSLEINDISRRIYSKKGTIYIQENNSKTAIIQIDDGIIMFIEGSVSDEDIVRIVESIQY